MNDTKKDKVKELIEKYGDECMVEACDLHYVPEIARKIKMNYKPEEDQLVPIGDYLIKGYNVRWLHEQDEAMKEYVFSELESYRKYREQLNYELER